MRVERKILLNPGPATTTDTVKTAMVVPDICPREKAFQVVMGQVRRELTTIVKGDTDFETVLFCGSGTAAMDTCINSVVAPAKKLAVINNGAYGLRMLQIARAYRIPVVEFKYEWGTLPDLTAIENAMARDKDIGCIAMVHHETSTGLLNPVREVGDVAARYRRLFIVDAISSFAGIPIDIKSIHADFLMSTSNKCIQGMPGLAFVICKKRELERLAQYPKRSFYLNLFQQYDYFERTGQMQFTPPVQVVYALQQAIAEYFSEGGQQRYERYSASWQALRKGLEDLCFEFLLKPEHEARLLTTVLEPDDSRFSFNKLHDLLYEQGFTIYPGKVDHTNTFRIATIGAINRVDIDNFLTALKTALTDMQVKMTG